jgi:protein TonB
VNDALRPYVARSFGLHAAALAAFALLGPRGALKPQNVYTIDFVGPATTIASAGARPASASEAPAKAVHGEIPAQTDPDAISTKRRPGGPVALPRPSLLSGVQDDRRPASPGAPTGSLAGPGAKRPAETATAAGTSAGPAGAGVATDLPNFPYPWYISQVRLMLWQSWQRRMPAIDAEGTVEFAILPDGGFTDLAVESSSGEGDFDRAALTAVQTAAPFPPLPRDFHDPFLKIHLTLKSEATWR